MGLQSKYTPAQIKHLNKKGFMKEASYDDMMTDMGKTFNVAVLCRESTQHADQKKALKDQTDRMLSLVERKNQFHLIDNGIFIEDGKSGLSIEVRPKFQEMIDFVVSNHVDIILVQEATRFSRNIGEFFSYMQILQNNEVGLIILEGEFWTYHMPPSDYPRLAAEVSKGQAESLTTSKRVSRGIDTYRERGQLVQGSMFGYDLVKAVERKNNTYKIQPIDGAAVQLIFDMYVNKGKGTDLIATHLNVNRILPFDRKSQWSASKVRRVLMNEKYMGYILYGKYEIVDTNTKKKIATHIEPKRTKYADDGVTVVEEGNLVRGNWEPLVDEETWWKAQEIRKSRSNELANAKKGNMRSGVRASSDSYANKAYCECGYRLSPQYTHAATDTEPAQFRYTCRQQINAHTANYRKKHGLPPLANTCTLKSVTDVKMRLMSIKVFQYLFRDIKDTLEDTIKIIEQAEKLNTERSSSVITLEALNETLEKLQKRLERYIDMRADGEISDEQYRSKKESTEEEIQSTIRLIQQKKVEISNQERYKLDINKIRDRLETYVDLSGFGVSNEMIDFFVERIIHRSNEEYIWEMNLSGLPNVPDKYKIRGYSKEYSDSLKDDKNFNIVKTFVISLEECREFCQKIAHRVYKPVYWQQITVKIAIK